VNVLQVFRVAVRALLRNKMRSFLTTLGIIIGVSAVIAMVALGEGAKARVQAAFASMGSNLLVIQSGSSHGGGVRGGAGSQPTLTWDDLEAIRRDVPSARYAAAVLRNPAQIVGGGQNWNALVYGTEPDYLAIREWGVDWGVGLSQTDVSGAAQVALLGHTVVEMLYGSNYDPVGEVVRLNNVPFQVVGVLEEKGQSPIGQDYDDIVVVPVTAFQRRISGGLQQYIAGQIYIGAGSPADLSRAEGQITSLLRERHRLQASDDDDFSIRNLTEMAEAMQEGMQTITTLLASIAAVSLLVGGIGIMNIMLVSVTERTREIGLRMAVGARPRDILAQFLVEAMVLSIAGGAIGVTLGVLAAQRLAAAFEWNALIRPDVVAVALIFSAAVGIGFGLYPARKASRLDPIDALRYE
jgi:putative ABC transport system permease protein